MWRTLRGARTLEGYAKAQASQASRSIASGKKNEAGSAMAKQVPMPPPPVTPEDFKDVNRNWVSYGFDERDRTTDENHRNATMFFSVTLALVGTCFFMSYKPDNTLKDWSSREAFLELRRREQLGLPLIDPNYVDPNTVELPSEEELKDVEIII